MLAYSGVLKCFPVCKVWDDVIVSEFEKLNLIWTSSDALSIYFGLLDSLT